MKLFLIEDDADIAWLLHIQFEMLGYEVALFNSRKDAIQSFFDLKPDIVISDYMTPDDIPVEDFITKVAKSNISKCLLLMSAYEEAQRIADCHGIDFIAKPFDLDEVAEKVISCLEKNRTHELKS
jgi:DNA-binding NtrC family response regulator